MTTSSARETKKILVTRSLHQANEFCMKIKGRSFEPVILPLIKVTPIIDTTKIESILTDIDRYTWIFFTSKNGVNIFFDFAKKFNVDIKNKKFACVGEKTEEELRNYGHTCSFTPSKFHAETFAKEIFQYITEDDYILYVKGLIARKVIPDVLRINNIKFDEMTVYDTITDGSQKGELINLLLSKQIDVITFTSPSAIESFIELTQNYNLEEILQNIKIAVIGPSSKKTAIDYGLQPVIMPEKYTLDGMLDEIDKYLRSEENE